MSKVAEWLAREAQADLDEHVRPEIQALVKRGNVTRAEVAELRCNSWEWHALVPALDDAAFVEHVEHAVKNSSVIKLPATTYDEAIVAVHVPELLRRFHRAARNELAFAETIDCIRQALDQQSTHHLVMADDVRIAVRALEAYASAFGEPSYRAKVALAMIRGDAVFTTCEACGKKIFVARPAREEDAAPATFCISCGGGCVSMPAEEMVSPKEGGGHE